MHVSATSACTPRHELFCARTNWKFRCQPRLTSFDSSCLQSAIWDCVLKTTMRKDYLSCILKADEGELITNSYVSMLSLSWQVFSLVPIQRTATLCHNVYSGWRMDDSKQQDRRLSNHHLTRCAQQRHLCLKRIWASDLLVSAMLWQWDKLLLKECIVAPMGYLNVCQTRVLYSFAVCKDHTLAMGIVAPPEKCGDALMKWQTLGCNFHPPSALRKWEQWRKAGIRRPAGSSLVFNVLCSRQP